MVKLIYDDEDYSLSVKNWFFGISWPILCSYYVEVKSRNFTFKVHSSDKAYLLAMLQHFIELGGRIELLKNTDFFRSYCEAVAVRKNMLGKYYFEELTALKRAELYYLMYSV